MPPNRLILAFDTSAAHCAVALYRGGVIAQAREDMTRGQAERLMPLIEETLMSQSLGCGDVDLIGVGTGPGNFTGIRIAVSAARGLGLSLDIPVHGVTTFDAVRVDDDHFGDHNDRAVALAAPRGFSYVQVARNDPKMCEPGSHDTPISPLPDDIAARIARVVQMRQDIAPDRPKPLYIRPADAAPPRQTAPRIL